MTNYLSNSIDYEGFFCKQVIKKRPGDDSYSPWYEVYYYDKLVSDWHHTTMEAERAYAEYRRSRAEY